jgi:hypothetical protein
MLRIAELLGFAAVAVGGTLTAIALAPTPSGAIRPGAGYAEAPAPAVSAAAQSPAPPIVHLPSIEVVGRRSEEPPRVEMARQHSLKGATRPKA